MELKEPKTFYAKTRNHWRKWLEKNHAKEKTIWLIIYRKGSKTVSVNYEEAVEEALCFGWIDSKAIKHDDESHLQSFAPRKPKSNWSKPNRERVAKMIKAGLMTPAGQVTVDLAKKTGTWTALEKVESMEIPSELQKLFDKNKTAHKNFLAFPPSSKKMILEWIMTAKKPETRKLRTENTVELAAKNIRAHHPAK